VVYYNVGAGAVANAALLRIPITNFPFSSPRVLPYVDPREAERRAIAERFARVARNLSGVEEVWLNAVVPDLEVGVVMRDLDLATELELRGIFIDLVCEVDPSIGELSVHAQNDGVPESVREGARLT